MKTPTSLRCSTDSWTSKSATLASIQVPRGTITFRKSNREDRRVAGHSFGDIWIAADRGPEVPIARAAERPDRVCICARLIVHASS
jgi:hypothetical protein